MTTTDTTRATELATRFAASKQAVTDGVLERRAIVNELLTFMTATEVADLLRITVARVGQIAAAGRRAK